MNRKLLKIALSLVFVSAASLALFLDFSKTLITADGKTYTYRALRKGTVHEALNHFDVKVGTGDLVRPALENELRWGERVTVVRVRVEETMETEEVDFILDWKRRTSKNLRLVEIQKGHRLRKTWRVTRVLHDGIENSFDRKLVKTAKVPVERLVFPDKRGFPRQVYDLSRARKMKVVATAYWLGDPQVPSDETYSGHKVERGLVAVDPAVIPLGWRLYIPGYGYAYSSDTGSAIKGKRIDLFVESKNASRAWEYKKVTVYLLEKSKEW